MGAMTSSLAAKFAFFPPTPPSYSIVEDPVTGKLRFEDIAPAENVEVTFLDTARGQRIAAMFVRNPRARLTVLYSHGNAADLGQVHDLYVELSNMLRVNLLGYDYTGYGASSGKPTEFNTYADIEAAFTYLTAQHRIRPEDIILYGQSVGSGPTVDLASRTPRLRGVVLHSPIMSGLRVLYEVKTSFFLDIFTNIDKLPKVECPVFVMHGTADDVVDVSHGRGLAAVCKRPFEALFIEGARHCDLEFFPEYLKQLRRFIAFLDQHPPPPLVEGEEDDIARRGKKHPPPPLVEGEEDDIARRGKKHPPPPLAEGEEDDIARRGKNARREGVEKKMVSEWGSSFALLIPLSRCFPSSHTLSHTSPPSDAVHFRMDNAIKAFHFRMDNATSGGSASARSSLHFFSSPAPSTTSSTATDADAEADKKPGNSNSVNGVSCAGDGAGAGAGGEKGGGAFGGWRARLGRPYKAPISELKQAAAAATTTTDSRGGDDAAAHAADTADTAAAAGAGEVEGEAVATEGTANRPAVASGAGAAGVKA
ncbi:unnamed protein product [Closterium sp. Naga37s-1]|nr:unnamed protein product [Closterium sp. Naga37s-1]